MNDKAVVVKGLTKIFPRVKAVDDVSFTVDEKGIFGLLGPNGAGKTTIIRMLLTLTKPTSGGIDIFGINALSHAARVRQITGYVPQGVSVDGELSGYENVAMYSRLYGVPGSERGQRIRDILRYLGLQNRAGDLTDTYSGGMMRRLEIAQALVNRPKILFLDEPSIGLDPAAQMALWELIRRARDEFDVTILLTTHDMNEADILCDRIGIMNRGKLIVTDEPSRLKSTMGGDVLTISSTTPCCADKLKELGYSVTSNFTEGQFDILVSNGERSIPHLLESLNEAGVKVQSVSIKKPTLDDVFLKYTGTRIEEGSSWDETRQVRRTFRRLTE